MKKFLTILLVFCVAVITVACKDNNGNTSVPNSTKEVEQSEKESTDTQNVKALNNEAFANAKEIYATDKYFYFVSVFGVDRIDKDTHTITKISDDIAEIVCTTKDSIYYIETGNPVKLYKIEDKMNSAEYLYSLSSEEYYFMRGKDIYAVSPNGSVTKHINSSKKYDSSAEIIYQGNEYSISDVSICNNRIYYTSGKNHTATYVPIDNGKSQKISLNGEFSREGFGTTSSNNKVYYCGNKIIYSDSEETIHIVNTDTAADVKIPDIKAKAFFVANNTIYVGSDNDFYCVDIETAEIEEFVCPADSYRMFGCVSRLSDVGTGIVYITSTNDLFYTDYDGNLISKMRRV